MASDDKSVRNILEKFIKLPKLELHAHLNGSLSESTIQRLSKLHNDCSESLPRITDQTNFKDLSSCFEIFSIAHQATRSSVAVRLATLWTIQEFADDGVVYLELRSTPRKENEKMSKEMYLTAIIDAITEAKTIVPNIIVTLLVSINRSEGYQNASENIDLAINFSTQYPLTVVGVDFSGNPTIGNFKDFVPLLQKARASGLKITLHCGEVDNAEEIDEMLNFRPERFGHVTRFSAEHIERLKSEKILVELCLSSNVLCGTVPDFASHHLEHFYSDHPFILGTDDKGVFDTTLSKEYEIAQQTFNMSDTSLWEMNFNSTYFIFAQDEVKNQLQALLLEWKAKHLD